MNNAENSCDDTCQASRCTKTCGRTTSRKSTSSAAATHAQSTPAPAATETATTPTSPDTSLPWSDDFALDGWSARMFLHQQLRTSTPHWRTSDTEQLLSDWTPQRLRGKAASATSLSDAIKKPGKASAESFRTSQMVRGLIRRALARGRSLRLLLRTEHDTIPAIVIFGKKVQDSGFWTVESGKRLPDYLGSGLLDFLTRHAPGCAETQ